MIPPQVIERAVRWAKRSRSAVLVFTDADEPMGYGLALEDDAWFYDGQTSLATVWPDGRVET